MPEMIAQALKGARIAKAAFRTHHKYQLFIVSQIRLSLHLQKTCKGLCLIECIRGGNLLFPLSTRSCPTSEAASRTISCNYQEGQTYPKARHISHQILVLL